VVSVRGLESNVTEVEKGVKEAGLSVDPVDMGGRRGRMGTSFGNPKPSLSNPSPHSVYLVRVFLLPLFWHRRCNVRLSGVLSGILSDTVFH